MAPAQGLTPLHRRPLILPGAAAAGAPTLRETLFPASGRIQGFDLADGIPIDLPNTAAGTHDGSDLTADGFILNDDGFGGAGCANYVGWTLDPATFGGAIAFVRAHFRIRFTTDPGATAYMGGMLDIGATFGGPIFFPPAFTNVSIDLALNPFTGLPWTAAAINAHAWGHNTNIFGPYSGSAQTEISEQRLEVWG